MDIAYYLEIRHWLATSSATSWARPTDATLKRDPSVKLKPATSAPSASRGALVVGEAVFRVDACSGEFEMEDEA